jgi:hypothetical protein
LMLVLGLLGQGGFGGGRRGVGRGMLMLVVQVMMMRV